MTSATTTTAARDTARQAPANSTATPSAPSVNPEVEAIVNQAAAAGKCSGVLVDVWREVGQQDIHKLRRLAAASIDTEHLTGTERLLTKYLVQVENMRHFIVALKLAAQNDVRETSGGALYWPSLLDGLERMIPDDGMLEVEVTMTLEAMRLLNWGASRHAERGTPAPARATNRAALAASASRPA